MERMLVRDIHTRHSDVHKAVIETTRLDEIVAMMAADPSIQIVFVVNSKGVYRGAITRNDLLNYVGIKLVGGKSTRSMSIGAVSRIVFAATAADLSRGGDQPPPVSDETDLATALGQMIDSKQSILPVLDADRKLVGDLRFSEVLNAALAAAGKDAEPKR